MIKLKNTSSVIISVIIILIFAIGLFQVAFCKEKPQLSIDELAVEFHKYYKKLPNLRKLTKEKKYKLRVKYVVDPDLASLAVGELKKLFKKTSTLAKKMLGYRVEFNLVKVIDIYDFFESKKENFTTVPFSYLPKSWYIDPFAKDTFARSLKAIKGAVDKKSDDILFQYFGKPGDYKNNNYDKSDYARKITKIFIQRMKGIFAEKDLSGRDLFSHKRKFHFSFAHWDAIAYQEKDADLIITNTLISGPDTAMPLYVINRGGITSAFVENNEHRPLQAVAIFPMYQFLADGKYFLKIRGKLTYVQKMNISAYMWIHELGHLLMRKEENYTLDGSVHKTAVDLNYLSWMRNVRKNHKNVKGAIGNLKKF